MAEVSHLSALRPALSYSKLEQPTQKSAITSPLKQEIPIDHRKDGMNFAELKERKTAFTSGVVEGARNSATEDKSRSTYQVALGIAHGALLTREVDARGNPTTSYPSKAIIERYEEQLQQQHTKEALNQNKSSSE